MQPQETREEDVNGLEQLSRDVHAGFADMMAFNRHQFQTLTGTLARHEMELRGLRADVTGLRADGRELRSDVDSLKGDVRELRSDVDSLKTDVRSLTTELRTFKTEVSGRLDSVDRQLALIVKAVVKTG